MGDEHPERPWVVHWAATGPGVGARGKLCQWMADDLLEACLLEGRKPM